MFVLIIVKIEIALCPKMTLWRCHRARPPSLWRASGTELSWRWTASLKSRACKGTSSSLLWCWRTPSTDLGTKWREREKKIASSSYLYWGFPAWSAQGADKCFPSRRRPRGGSSCPQPKTWRPSTRRKRTGTRERSPNRSAKMATTKHFCHFFAKNTWIFIMQNLCPKFGVGAHQRQRKKEEKHTEWCGRGAAEGGPRRAWRCARSKRHFVGRRLAEQRLLSRLTRLLRHALPRTHAVGILLPPPVPPTRQFCKINY